LSYFRRDGGSRGTSGGKEAGSLNAKVACSPVLLPSLAPYTASSEGLKGTEGGRETHLFCPLRHWDHDAVSLIDIQSSRPQVRSRGNAEEPTAILSQRPRMRSRWLGPGRFPRGTSRRLQLLRFRGRRGDFHR